MQQQANIERATKIIRHWMPQSPDTWEEIAQAAARNLADDNLIMADPATPSMTSIKGYHTYHPFAIWHAEGITVNLDHENTIYIESDDDDLRPISMSPEQAKALIPMIIAAINYAEKDTP